MKLNVIKNNGFTIVELLITSVVISVGLLSVVSMMVNTFVSSAALSSNLTASYLTQEGFELVRRVRDTNFNKRYTGEEADEDRFWLSNLMESGDVVVGGMDYESESLEEGLENQNLRIDNNGLFGYSGGEETSFQREIRLERGCYDGYLDDDFEDDYCGEGEAEYIEVKITVSWSERGEEKKYEAKSKLFNWY